MISPIPIILYSYFLYFTSTPTYTFYSPFFNFFSLFFLLFLSFPFPVLSQFLFFFSRCICFLLYFSFQKIFGFIPFTFILNYFSFPYPPNSLLLISSFQIYTYISPPIFFVCLCGFLFGWWYSYFPSHIFFLLSFSLSPFLILSSLEVAFALQ